MAAAREEIVNTCDTLPARYNIGFSKIKVESKPIARGMFGSLHRGRWGGRAVAVKKFDLNNTDHNFNLAAKEMARMIRLRHPNVLKVHGFYFVAKGRVLKCSMVMELMEFDLDKYIEQKYIENSWPWISWSLWSWSAWRLWFWSAWSLTWRSILNRSILKPGEGSSLTDDEVVYIMAEIARGMKHVHENGYSHRDLKPQNVLMRRSAVFTGYHLDVKVADFGSSELMSAGQCDRNAGTSCYKAPEQFDRHASNLQAYKMDVYSFGCTCFKLWTGRDPPFKNHAGLTELWEQLKRARNLPNNVEGIITECLDIDPDARPGFCKISDALDAVLKERQVEQVPPREQVTDDEAMDLDRRRKEIVRELGLDGGENGLNYAIYVILPEELVVRRINGGGSDGGVYKVDWKGTPCALKVIALHYSNHLDELLPYLKMLPTLIHDNIVRFFGYSLKYRGRDRLVGTLMEFLGPDLMNYLRKYDSIPFPKRWKIMKGIAEGMKFLHAKGMVHGDLKPSNILVNEDVDANDIVVKLIDFCLVSNQAWRVASRYAAPEVLQARRDRNWRRIIDYKKSDVYSFAITCSDILSEDMEYSCIRFQRRVIDGRRPSLPEETSQDLQDLITRCWSHDPAKRPSFNDVCNFFSQPMPVFAIRDSHLL